MRRLFRPAALLTGSVVVCTALAACTTSTTSGSSDDKSSARDQVEPGTIPIGLITDTTGPSGLFGPPTKAVAELAVDQINAEGGVDGREVSLLTEDGATDPTTSKAAASRLVDEAGVVALFTMMTTAQSEAAHPVAGAAGVPYFYAPIWEGGVCEEHFFSQGEVPAQQLAPTIPWVQEETDRTTWYLLGNDYAWPRNTFELAKSYIEEAGGEVVGEDYVPLGTTDFSAAISKVQSSGADVMIPALVGGDAIAFEKQAYDAGLDNDEVQRLAVLYEDNTRAAMGADVTAGMYFATNYDQSMDNDANADFVEAYREKFGSDAAPITTLSEHTYLAIKAWAAAADAAGSTDLAPLADALEGLVVDSPAGPVTFEGHYVRQSISVVEVGEDGSTSVEETFADVDPQQDCVS